MHFFLILALQASLPLQITLQPPIAMALHDESLSVKGYVKVVTGNQMPGPAKSIHKSVPLEGIKVVAVSGSVKTIDEQPSIQLSSISSEMIKASTDKSGGFQFFLKQGLYTFFLVYNDKAYLNSFDGCGYFMTTKVTAATNDLLLIDDRNTIY